MDNNPIISEQEKILEELKATAPDDYEIILKSDGYKSELEQIKKREEAYSAFDRFAEKAVTTKGLTARVSDLLAEMTGTQTEIEWWNAEEGYHLPSLVTLEERLDRYNLGKEWKEAWDSGDQQRKAAVLDKLHYERTKEKYGDIALKEAPSTTADVLGELFGYIADPSSALPASTLTKTAGTAKTMLNIAGVSGSTSALDVAVGEYAEKGEINPGHISVGFALGAIAPNAFYLLGKRFGKIVEKHSQKTGKSAFEAAEEIEKAVVEDRPIDILGKEYFVKEPDPYRKRWSELTDEDFYKKPLMEDMEYRQKYTDRYGLPKEVGGRSENIPELPPVEEVDPYRNRWSTLTEEDIVRQKEGDIFRRRLFANVEEGVEPGVPEVDLEATRHAWMLAQTSPKTELLLGKVEDAVKPKSGALDLEWRPHPFEGGLGGSLDEPRKSSIRLLVPKDYTEEEFIKYVRSLDKSPPPPEWKRSYAPFTKEYTFASPEEVPFSKRSPIPNEEIKPGYIDPDNNVVVRDKETRTFYERNMTPEERRYKERKWNVQEVRKAKDNQYWEAKRKEEAFLKEESYEAPEINFKGKALPDDVSYTSVDLYKESAVKRAVSRLDKRDKKALNDILNNQAGVSQLDVMSHMASSALGAMYGFYDNGWEGAKWGLVAGLAAPTIIKHGWKGLKSVKDWSARDYTTAAAFKHVRATGQNVIRGYGQAGRILAEKFDLYKEDVEMAVGEKITALMDSLYQNGFKKLTKAERTNFLSTVRGVLDHTIEETDSRVTRDVLNVVRHQQKAFDEILDEAVEKGVYTREVADSLSTKAKTEGYFPRMWDHVFLDSPQGREAFLTKFTEEWQDEDAARRLLESMLPEDKYVSQYMTLTRKNGDKVQFTYEAAKRILDHFDKLRKNVRSTHLEETRKLKNIDEDFLKQFMLKDPMAILKEYYVDVYSRLKTFPYFHGIDPDGKIREHKQTDLLFEEIKTTHGGLAEEYTKENYYLLLKDSERSQTFRSLVGQDRKQRKLLQYLHAYTTITKLALAAIPNAVQAIAMGGIKASNAPVSVTKLLAKQFWDIPISGKFGTGERRHFADRLGSALDLTLMEVYSEGSGEVGRMTERFLKGTGFFGAERFNRVFATNLGREYAIELMDVHGKHMSGTKRLSPRKLEKLTKAMREMSLPTDRPVMIDDINRASVRFNNTVNYVAAPYKMPLALQTPWGRVAGKFKTFTIQTSMFVRDNIIKPAVLFTGTGGRSGSIKPLITALTMTTVLGMPLDHLRRWIKEDDKEYSNTEEILRGMMMLGGLGFVQDFIGSFGSNIPGRVYETVLGPIVSDAVKIGTGLYKTGQEALDTFSNGPVTEGVQRLAEGTFDTFQKQIVIPAPVSVREIGESLYRDFVMDRPTYSPNTKISPEMQGLMEDYFKRQEEEDVYKTGYAEGGLVNASGSDTPLDSSLVGEDYTQEYWRNLWGIPTGGGGGSPMFSLKRDLLMQILGMGEFDASRRTPTATA